MPTTVNVRPAAPGDAAGLLAWRNDPGTVTTSLSGAPVAADEHARWFAGVLADPARVLLIGELADGTAIGMCRFDVDGSHAEVSINLDPQHRGRGLARPLLISAIDELRVRAPRVATLTAQVRAGNAASLRLFASAGFVARSGADDVRWFERDVAAFSGTDPS